MLDTIDKKLINLLQQDSKQTTKQLSLQLNLSVTAVYERVKKLENQKVIEKYVAIVNKDKIEKSFLVFCHIKLMQHSKEYLNTFEYEYFWILSISYSYRFDSVESRLSMSFLSMSMSILFLAHEYAWVADFGFEYEYFEYHLGTQLSP